MVIVSHIKSRIPVSPKVEEEKKVEVISEEKPVKAEPVITENETHAKKNKKNSFYK